MGPRGVSTNGGSSSSAPLDLVTAINTVQPGQMLLLLPGTDSIAYTSGKANTLVLSKAGTASTPLKIVAANCGRAVIEALARRFLARQPNSPYAKRIGS